MDPSTLMFEAIMYPSAIFAGEVPPLAASDASPATWLESSLNPRNRVDSLDPVQNSRWRIDGGEADGTRFFATPDFVIDKPPLRIDTWIPNQHRHPPSLQTCLRSSSAMLVPSSNVYSLPISDYVLRALNFWSTSQSDFEEKYWSMPFGSQIVINELSPNIPTMEISFLPVYDVEQQWLSVRKLQSMWQLPQDIWPRSIDYTDLRLQRQLHEAISLVSLSGHKDCTNLFIFKSLVNDVKYMYHEMKLLLSMPPHANVISRPLYIVTRQCRFGGKVGVCGFILPYHPHGTLQDQLSTRRSISLSYRVRWARELTEALIHIRSSPALFYSNLKLNNILMTSDTQSSTTKDLNNLSVKVIDFEQHTGWYSWSPPEISYIEYLDYLVSSEITPPLVKAHYENLLRSYSASYRPRSRIFNYVASDAPQTYAPGWMVLTPREQESAQVYLLGMLLWCIFEESPSLNNFITVETFREPESHHSFPEFERTPVKMRTLIKRCTAGAREWHGLQHPLVRMGDKLYPRDAIMNGTHSTCGVRETQDTARSWWKQEIADAEAFVNARIGQRQETAVRSDGEESERNLQLLMTHRPSLEEVLDSLTSLEALESKSAGDKQFSGDRE